ITDKMFKENPELLHAKAVIVDDDFEGDIDDIDFDNPPPGITIFDHELLSDEDQAEITTLLTSYFETYSLIQQLKAHLQTLMDRQQKTEKKASSKEKQETPKAVIHKQHPSREKARKIDAEETQTSRRDEQLIKEALDLSADIKKAQEIKQMRKSGQKQDEA